MVTREVHSRFLDYIVENPFLIDEEGHLDWVLREGIWRINDSRYMKMPDLFMKFDTQRYVICELKHCYERVPEAIEQLQSGVMYARRVLKIANPLVTKIAFYSEGTESLQYEEVKLEPNYDQRRQIQARTTY
jgi:hypothetical protein